MIDDFDHILRQLLSNLPQHSPKSDVWNKISSSLDEDLAMSRLKRILKNSERPPRTDLWPAIESSLNRPVFWKLLFKSSWVKFGIPSLIVLTTLLFIYPYFNGNKKSIVSKPLSGNSGLSDIFPYAGDQNINYSAGTVIPVRNISEVNKGVTATNGVSGSVDNRQSQNNNDSQHLLENNSVGNNVNETNSNSVTTDLNNSFTTISVKEYSAIYPLSAMVSWRNCQAKNITYDELPGFVPKVSPKKDVGHADFSVDLSYSPEMSFMKLQNTSDDYTIDLVKRKQAELPSYSWSAGIEGKMDLRHVFFQAGVNYSKISSLSEYRYTYSGVDTLGWELLDTMFVHSYADSLGIQHDTLFIIYTWNPVTQDVSYDYTKRAAMQISYLQIPVVFGYGISRGKFQYSASGGVSFGIPLSIKGSMIESDNYTVSDVAQQALPLNKIVYTGLLRLGVNYFVSPHYSVFVQPSAKFMLNSVFDKSYAVDQKYWSVGLRFGLNYRF
jgi:hypothetical protein